MSKKTSVSKVIGLVILFLFLTVVYFISFFVLIVDGGQFPLDPFKPLAVIAFGITILPSIIVIASTNKAFDKGNFLKKYWAFCGTAIIFGLLLMGLLTHSGAAIIIGFLLIVILIPILIGRD